MTRTWFAITLCLVFGSATAAQNQVYKWTDAAGMVHYSDRPPPQDAANVQRLRVSSGDSPHAADTEAAAQSTDAGKSAASNAAPPAATVLPDTPDNRAKACANARNNLELLQSKFPVSMTGPDGKPQPLDEKQRQAQIADANAQIALYCK